MPVARQSASVLAKVYSGGGANYGVPTGWSQSMYGSGWPIAPVTAPKDVEVPRSIDFPIAVNSTLVPRTGYGLMPFTALLEAYENVAEVKAPVSLIHRELNGFIPRLVDPDGNAIDDHPYDWMTKSPDRKTPFGVWLTRFLKSAKVYDAPAVYLQRTPKGIEGLHYIDGSTLFLIVDQNGNVPDPEPVDAYVKRVRDEAMSSSNLVQGDTSQASALAEFVNRYMTRQRRGQAIPTKIPAYTQVIKGTPFSWWSSDNIWYMPQSRRMNAPYGESFIESAWFWIMIIVNITSFELAHYRTGNMPEGFVTVPKDWFASVEALQAAELSFNARMTSNPATERMRVRFFPDGSKYFGTKKADFPRDLYKQANDNILNAIGVLASEFGEMPGQGLGGKGFKEGAASDTGRHTLDPHRKFVASFFNYVLEQDGVDDATFDLGYSIEEVDPDKKKASAYEGMAHGALTLNDVLGELGYNPVEGSMEEQSDGSQRPIFSHIANKHLIVAGEAIYVVEDMQTQNGMAVPSYSPKQGGEAGGEPVGPETAVEQDGGQHSPQDLKTLQEAIRNIQDKGTLTGKFISVPSGQALRKDDATHSDGAMIAVMIPIEAAQQLRQIAENIGFPEDAQLEKPENMHVTLAYLPNGMEAQAQQSTILGALKFVTAPVIGLTVLNGHIQGYGVFNGQDGMKVLFALLDEPQLPLLRTTICQALDAHNIEYGRDFGFVPHITMAYFPEEFELPAGFAVPNIPVMIDAVTLAFGDQYTPVPFTATVSKAAEHDTRLSRVQAEYVATASNPDERCALCVHFIPGGACQLVKGAISDDGWCKLFEAEEESSPVSVEVGGQAEKLEMAADLVKFSGVDPEDDDYFGAPISREVQFTFPNDHHANDVEIVAMIPDGLPPKAAIWKPEGGETDGLQSFIGGPQYLREEAAYILDRSLGFMLVPLAYVAESYGEYGAAIMYSLGAAKGKGVATYSAEWLERAAVLDFIMAQQDRGASGHNYLTHPNDPGRPVLIDNGLTFPIQDWPPQSGFSSSWVNHPLSESTLAALTLCRGDASAWSDIQTLLGEQATQFTRQRLQQLLDEKMIDLHIKGTSTILDEMGISTDEREEWGLSKDGDVWQ